MARNIARELRETWAMMAMALKTVKETKGLPVSAELGRSLIMATAYLGVIEINIRKARTPGERKVLIEEYDARQTIIRSVARDILEQCQPGTGKAMAQGQEGAAVDLPGLRLAVNS